MESESCYNATTAAAMREADDIIAGRVEAKRYHSFDELVADLDSEN
jgi:DNA-damage-inducible protein J